MQTHIAAMPRTLQNADLKSLSCFRYAKKAAIWSLIQHSQAKGVQAESAFCSNHVRKRTFLGVLNRRFETRLFENKHGRNSVLL